MLHLSVGVLFPIANANETNDLSVRFWMTALCHEKHGCVWSINCLDWSCRDACLMFQEWNHGFDVVVHDVVLYNCKIASSPQLFALPLTSRVTVFFFLQWLAFSCG